MKLPSSPSLMLALLALAPLAAAQAPAALRQAAARWAAGDIAGTRAALAPLRRADPAAPQVNVLWGETAFAQHDCREALGAFERAGAWLPRQPAAALMAAVCALRSGEPRRAQAFLLALPRPAPVPPEAALALSAEAERAGDVALAWTAFQLAPSDRPSPALHAYDAAALQLAAGNAAAAATGLAAQRAAGEDSAAIENLLGNAYEAQIRPGPHAPPLIQQAYEAYRRGTQLDPHEPANFLDAGRLMLKYQQYDVASRILSAGLAVNPRAWALYLERGIGEAFSGHGTQAEADLRQAGQLAPDNPLPYLGRGLLAMQQARYAQAAGVLRSGLEAAHAAVAHAAENASARAWLNYLEADALSRMSDRTAAQQAEMLRASAETRRLAPKFADGFALAGRIALAARQPRQARTLLARAHQLAPDNPQFLYQLARAEQQLDSARARADLARFQVLEKTHDAPRVRKYFIRIFVAQPAPPPPLAGH